MGRFGCNKNERSYYTEDQVKALLKKHDKNKDKQLDWNEVIQVFKELGAAVPPYRAWRAFRMADDDGDGKISEDEKDDLVKYIVSLQYPSKR